jgi:tRNA threonylcarbamoyladenosine biosynthesis protein TsaE
MSERWYPIRGLRLHREPDSNMIEARIRSNSPESTMALARSMARRALPGDRFHLEGDLGAGKTTFVRGFVVGLDHPDPREVSSPTFAIHHTYEGGRMRVHHLDLYRLEAGEEMERQGILDPIRDQDAVCLIEWSERLPLEAQAATASITFCHDFLAGAEVRELVVHYINATAKARLHSLPES